MDPTLAFPPAVTSPWLVTGLGGKGELRGRTTPDSERAGSTHPEQKCLQLGRGGRRTHWVTPSKGLLAC